MGAVALDANTVQLTYDGTDFCPCDARPADLQVSGTYFSQPHLVDQGEGLCIQTIQGLDGLEECPTKLDIKPGSCPNSFNRNSNGVLPVALVGTDDFNVLDVDLSTLELSRADGVGGQATPLEGPPGPHSVVEDAATPFDGELCDCHELEGDGPDDLSLKFDSPEVVAELELDDFSRRDLVELCVSGTLLDGTPFDACDCIRIVK